MRASKQTKKKGRLQKKRIKEGITNSPTIMDNRPGRQAWINRRDKRK